MTGAEAAPRPASQPTSDVVRVLPAERRHTIHFLRAARSASPVFLDTDVDMTWVLGERARRRENAEVTGASVPSVVTYVVVAAGQVLAGRPDANAAIGGRWRPKIVNYASVHAKLVLDRTHNGQRLVASIPLRDVDRRRVDDVQRDLERARDTPLDQLPELRGLLLMHRLPVWLGWPLFRAAVGGPRRRQELLGTFAVSSLGHLAVNGFHAVGGTALTFNLGRVRDTPVVRAAADGSTAVAVAPVMRLNLAFDHRVLDGAAAAEVLTDVRAALEAGAGLGGSPAGPDAGPAGDVAPLVSAPPLLAGRS